MDSLKLTFKTFGQFISEQAYDEQDPAPKASYRAQDYQIKDDLRTVVVTIDEILSVIEDGEQLEDAQVKMIKDVIETIARLKRQIEGRERIKDDDEEKKKEEEELNNPG